MKQPETANYKCFTHRTCECFPCHPWKEGEPFNCLFCWCPLYALKDKCGGDFVYSEEGIKDCSNCKLPHIPQSYDYIVEKFSELMELTKL